MKNAEQCRQDALTFISISYYADKVRMCAGHCYYFLEDVYPRMTGRRPLRTPSLVKALFPAGETVRMVHLPPQPPQNAGFQGPGVVPEPGQPGQQDAR